MDFSIFDLYSETTAKATKVHQPYTYPKLPVCKAIPETPDSVQWDDSPGSADGRTLPALHTTVVLPSLHAAQDRSPKNRTEDRSSTPFVPLVHSETDCEQSKHRLPRKSIYGPQLSVWQTIEEANRAFRENHSYTENVAYWKSYYETQARRKVELKSSEDCKTRLVVRTKKAKHRSMPIESYTQIEPKAVPAPSFFKRRQASMFSLGPDSNLNASLCECSPIINVIDRSVSHASFSQVAAKVPEIRSTPSMCGIPKRRVSLRACRVQLIGARKSL